MKSLRALLPTVVLALGCGGGEAGESTGSTRQALREPGAIPVPCRFGTPSAPNGYGPTFDGTTVDLMTADALVECMATPPGTPLGDAPYFPVQGDARDAYMLRVLQQIQNTVFSSGYTGLTGVMFERWEQIRSNPATSCDPQTMEPTTAGVQLARHPVREYMFPPSDPTSFEGNAVAWHNASWDLRTAGVNLCVAQKLRTFAPGASAGPALLLSGVDQRLLLETIRERAQVAMLQYAMLGQVFASRTAGGSPNLATPTARLDLLKAWAAEQSSQRLREMGRDFATAVQLHALVSEELATLFARSRSARTPGAEDAVSRADELWGPGSWYQRMFALLYGGDPLVTDDDGPWVHWNDRTVGGPSSSSLLATGHDWPRDGAFAYAQTDVSSPQVQTLLALARQFDELRLTNLQVTSALSCPLSVTSDTGLSLYKRIEGKLRQHDCFGAGPGDPCPSAVPPPYDFGTPGEPDYLLWTKYRITPEHAQILASYLFESAVSRQPFEFPYFVDGCRTYEGVMSSSGNVSYDPAARELHIDPNGALAQRDFTESIGRFTRNAVMRFPEPWDANINNGDSARTGFPPACTSVLGGVQGQPTENAACDGTNGAPRTLGAVTALAATRHMVMGARTFIGNGFGVSARLGDYYAYSDQVLRVIDAAIGPSGVDIVPAVLNAAGGVISSQNQLVQILVPEDDPFWADNGCVANGTPNTDIQDNVPTMTCCNGQTSGCNLIRLYAVSGPAVPTSLARIAQLPTFDGVPEIRFLGEHVLNYINEANNKGHFGFVGTDPNADTGPSGQRRLWVVLPLFEPNLYTLVAVKQNTTSIERKVVAPYIELYNAPYQPPGGGAGGVFFHGFQAQYIASGGRLGDLLRKQGERLPYDPTTPAFDGFGLRNDWVPPFTAELLGGNSGESSVQRYMALAKEAADEASLAVDTALSNLVEEERDDSRVAEADARAELGLKEEQDKLCGTANPNCDTSMIRTSVAYPSVTDCITPAPGQDPVECQIDHAVFRMVSTLSASEFDVARAVALHVNEPSAPAFNDYSGGALQSAFIEQWRALRAPFERINALVAARNSVLQQIATARVELDVAQSEADYACSPEAMSSAVLAGSSISVGASAGFPSGVSVSVTASYTPGPLIAQIEKCRSLQNQLAVPKQRAVQVVADAFSALASAGVGLVDAQAAIVQSSATIASLLDAANVATNRYEAEIALTSEFGRATSFGLSRRYRTYDVWRAKALLESARRYAVAARRAIEARYVVNLSELEADEPFVAGPKIWADEVYDYDLSLPAAVGLVLGEGTSSGVFTNKVKDYVGNLERFVTGYSAARPTAISRNEIEVVTLPGLSPDSPFVIGQGEDETTIYPENGRWAFRCVPPDGQPHWEPLNATQTVLEVCPQGELPDRARLSFSLDPWGRVDRGIANEPFESRFNTRWGLLAVNFVGTGIRDCQLAEDPTGCYAEGFIRYNLRHVGPAWVTDAEGIWKILGVPPGMVDGGKALAAELWLDPLKDGWSTSYIGAVARSELELRPMGGAYELEFPVTPDLVLEHIERVQLLVGSESWVRQR